MAHYLLKTEPSTYSFADLEREGSTLWEGITSPAGVKNLREMNAGDQLVIYHSGKDKRVVGTATVKSVDAKDPKVPRVIIQAGKPISHPLTLAEIKASPRFKTSLLVRQSRLSVVPLTLAQYQFLVGTD